MTMKRIIQSKNVPIMVWTDDIDHASEEQLLNIASLDFIHHHVAAMPDVHYGIGATIGSVIATHEAIIPAAVGVDIGCGMIACKTTLKLSDFDEVTLKKVYDDICRDIPVGFHQHDDSKAHHKDALKFEWRLDSLVETHPDLLKTFSHRFHWINQIGTLGGGNHFIEICYDEFQNIWIMLHSGSRGLGHSIATYFIELAKNDMLKNDIHLPDKDLAYLKEGSDHFTDYIHGMLLAQDYAFFNRQVMMRLVTNVLLKYFPNTLIVDQEINCHHNYVRREFHFGKWVWLTRKGAIDARKDVFGIVPGSMGALSFVVVGRGNPDSFNSSAHGAGRKMSRTKAKKQFTEEDLINQTLGVMCRKDAEVIDEIPGAYKCIHEVMENQIDLTQVKHALKQIICIKG